MPDSSHYTATRESSHGKRGANLIAIKGPEVGLGIESQGLLSEKLEKVLIGQNKERYFQVGSQLPPFEKAALVKFLEDNMDVFA